SLDPDDRPRSELPVITELNAAHEAVRSEWTAERLTASPKEGDGCWIVCAIAVTLLSPGVAAVGTNIEAGPAVGWRGNRRRSFGRKVSTEGCLRKHNRGHRGDCRF